ncbi:MAG: FAD-binding oxidoreductase [Kofleriaceae bacterium]
MVDLQPLATTGTEVLIGDELATSWTGNFREDSSIDYGRVVQKRPVALLRPRDREQLAACMRHLFATRTPYTTRGAAHSSGGQALIDGGVVIDMRHLARVVDDDPAGETVTVEGGAWWLAVVEHLYRQGRRPMSVTANLRSSIAGTLAVGGFGDSAHLHGLQIGHVVRMTVCTPDGELHRVGPGDELFGWTLAGRGQLGVIVDATLRTIRRPWWMVVRKVSWGSLADYVRDAEVITSRELYDFSRARIEVQGARTVISAVVGRSASSADADPRIGELHPEMVQPPGFIDLYRLLVAEKSDDKLACPALEFVLPMESAVDAWAELQPMVAAAGIPALQKDGHSVMIVAREPGLPLAPLPADTSMMIALRPKLPVEAAPALLPSLRAIGHRAMELGAKMYLMSIELDDPQFAERQFGEHLAKLRALKARFDPHGILNPGLL